MGNFNCAASRPGDCSGTSTQAIVSMMIMGSYALALLVAATLAPQGSTRLPWVFPGDFRDRLRMSDLVVSGTILGTAQGEVRTVDGADAMAHVATIRIDRVFQGNAVGRQLRFTWFSLYMQAEKGSGFAYSGPPLADFHSGKRYLLFLKRAGSDWEVAIPVYAIEQGLAAAPPRGSVSDLSRATMGERYRALAEELEDAALAQPVPPKGMTGEASLYFPSIFDLLGACAEHFYDRFTSSSSPELRKAAATWLDLIHSRRSTCQEASAETPR